jgi:hypothetical protein
MGTHVTLGLARRHLLLIAFAAAVLTVGCGSGSLLQSPTGPSGALSSDSSLSAESEASVSSAYGVDTLAKGRKPGKNPADTDDRDEEQRQGEVGDSGRGHDEKVVGFVSAKISDTLTVNGVIVVAGPGAVIRHGSRTLTIANIEVGDHIQARGIREGTTLVASEIKVEDTGRDNDDLDEVEGLIFALSGTSTCPALTFNVGPIASMATTVNTNSSTTFTGVTCAALANGARVEIEGTKQSDGSITAASVELH